MLHKYATRTLATHTLYTPNRLQRKGSKILCKEKVMNYFQAQRREIMALFQVFRAQMEECATTMLRFNVAPMLNVVKMRAWNFQDQSIEEFSINRYIY